MANYIPFFLIPFIGWGVWRFLKKKNDLTPLKKRTFMLGIGAFFLTEMARSFYRPYIYANELEDYFIANTLGNSLGTITAIFMVLTLAGTGTSKDWKLIVILLVGLVGYEFLPILSGRPLDVADLIATLIFGTFSTLAYAHLLNRYGHTSAVEKETETG